MRKIVRTHIKRKNDDVILCTEGVTIQCMINALPKLNMTDKHAMSLTALVFVAVANSTFLFVYKLPNKSFPYSALVLYFHK